jgi:hypothetical protein
LPKPVATESVEVRISGVHQDGAANGARARESTLGALEHLHVAQIIERLIQADVQILHHAVDDRLDADLHLRDEVRHAQAADIVL